MKFPGIFKDLKNVDILNPGLTFFKRALCYDHPLIRVEHRRKLYGEVICRVQITLNIWYITDIEVKSKVSTTGTKTASGGGIEGKSRPYIAGR